MHSRSASACRTGRLRSVAGLALGLGWALAVSGCGAPVPVASPPSSRLSPSPAGSSSSPAGREVPAGRLLPAAAVERVRVAAAYRRFWSVSVAASGRPPGEWRRVLSAVAAEPLLSYLVDGLSDQRARGRADYGVVLVRPSVVALEADRASVVDCQDASRSGERDLDSGLPLTVGSARTPVAAVLRWLPGRGWLVSEARYVGGSC